MGAPVRRHVDCSAAAVRADETSPAPDVRERQIVGKFERCKGESRRVLARRICARHKEAFEAVALKVRDCGQCERHGCFVGCVVGFQSRESLCASAI